MTFWGIEVKADESFTLESYELGGSLMLTQATLGVGSSSERSVLQVNVGDKKPISVCSLVPEVSECSTLNLEFNEEDEFTFSVVGPTSIHLSGYVRGSNGSDFDDFGEDVDETESEDNEVEPEDDMLMHPSSPAHNNEVSEEVENEEKLEDEKGGNKRVEKKKKKKKKVSFVTDSDRKAQQRQGKTDALELESEDEDGFGKHQANTGNKKTDRRKSKKRKNGAKVDGDSSSDLKRNVDVTDQNEERTIDGDASEDKKKRKKKKPKTQKEETVGNVKQNVNEITLNGNQDEKIAAKVGEETKRSKHGKKVRC